jgi:methylglutaconyl-CoA hydratase
MEELFKYSIDDRGVAEVKLNRPEIHNAFNDELILKLTNLFLELDENKSVRIIVLTGEGRSFCAGADLNWMKSMVDYSEEENIADSKKLYKMFNTINNCSKPVIGKINGHALGGGVGLVAVCDIAVTHNKAKFGFTETRLGLVPAVISPFCIAKIGASNARAWFLSGEMFQGTRAKDLGLVHEVVEVGVLDSRIEELIQSQLKAGPIATTEAKKLIKQVMSLPIEKIEDYTCATIAARRTSDEGQEGMNALLEKRKPNWIQND